MVTVLESNDVRADDRRVKRTMTSPARVSAAPVTVALRRPHTAPIAAPAMLPPMVLPRLKAAMFVAEARVAVPRVPHDPRLQSGHGGETDQAEQEQADAHRHGQSRNRDRSKNHHRKQHGQDNDGLVGVMVSGLASHDVRCEQPGSEDHEQPGDGFGWIAGDLTQQRLDVGEDPEHPAEHQRGRGQCPEDLRLGQGSELGPQRQLNAFRIGRGHQCDDTGKGEQADSGDAPEYRLPAQMLTHPDAQRHPSTFAMVKPANSAVFAEARLFSETREEASMVPMPK